jgi:hypothetical protein
MQMTFWIRVRQMHLEIKLKRINEDLKQFKNLKLRILKYSSNNLNNL